MRGLCDYPVFFPCILRAALTTEAFVSQHIFADWLVGRRRGRKTSSMAVLPLGKEGSSVRWHRPWAQCRTCPGFPLLTSCLWREGPRLGAAPVLINSSVPASALLSPLPQDTVRLFPGKKEIALFQLLLSSDIVGVIWQPGTSRDRSLLAVGAQPPCAEHACHYQCGSNPASWHQRLGTLPGTPGLTAADVAPRNPR